MIGNEELEDCIPSIYVSIEFESFPLSFFMSTLQMQ